MFWFRATLPPLEVGACFARRCSAALDTARRSDTPISLTAIYRKVVAEMDRDTTDALDRERLTAVYQFVIAGNTDTPICGSHQ